MWPTESRNRPLWLLALCLALALVTASCASAAQNKSPAALDPPAPSSTPASTSAPPPTSAPASAVAICGSPPCDKYLTRSETRSLDHAVSGHPIASAIALHLVVSALCGGVLCIWGEGFSFVYVEHETRVAAQNNECLRVHVLPKGHEWQLVNLDASNQSPYCTD